MTYEPPILSHKELACARSGVKSGRPSRGPASEQSTAAARGAARRSGKTRASTST